MSGKLLLEALSFVDEKFVDEAERKSISKSAVPEWRKAAALAACLCIIVVSAFAMWQQNRGMTECAAGEAAPGEMEGAPMEQEAPAGAVETEEYRITLSVYEWNETGFVGKVEESDLFAEGELVTVILEPQEASQSEDAEREKGQGTDFSPEGSVITLQFQFFDGEKKIIYVSEWETVE